MCIMIVIITNNNTVTDILNINIMKSIIIWLENGNQKYR